MKAALGAKRDAVEGELRGLGRPGPGRGAGAGGASTSVLHYCRLFEGEFRRQLNSTENTGRIRSAFVGEGGLEEQLRRVELARFLAPARVRAVCRRSNGYQAHLLSPEKGIRAVVAQTMASMLPAAEKCVRDVTFCLNQIVDTSAAAAMSPGIGAAGGVPARGKAGADPAANPNLLHCLSGLGREILAAWSEETAGVVDVVVSMEGSYITHAFFRRLLARRFPEAGSGDGGDGEAQPTAAAAEGSGRPPLPERPSGAPLASARRTSSSSADPRRAPIQSPRNSLEDLMQPGAQSEYMMGFLEKTSDSNRVGPMDSWKWQRRWFVLADAKRNLYYFRDPDELPNFRGCINMEECLVEDLAATQAARNAGVRDPWDFGSPAGQNGGGAGNGDATPEGDVSRLIALSSRNPSKPIHKDNSRIVLRAESEASKYEWLARMKAATKPPPSGSNPSRATPTVRGPSAPRLGAGANSSDEEDGPTRGTRGQQHLQAVATGARSVSGYFMGLLHGKKAQAAATPAGGGGSGARGGRQGEEAFYAMLSEDLFTYTESIVKSLCRTIPKAVVNGMVQKAEVELLDCMYEKVSNMDAVELSVFSSPEDSEVVQQRAGHEAALGDLDAALGVVAEALGHARGQQTAAVPAWVLELAGMLPGGFAPQLSPGKYLPKALLDAATLPGSGASPRSAPGRSATRTPPPRLQGAPGRDLVGGVGGSSSTSSVGAAKPRRRPPPPPPPKK